MNLVFTIVAVVLVIAGVFFSKISKKETQTLEPPQVLSVEEEKEEQVTPTVELHQAATSTPTKPPTPTNTPRPVSTDLSNFQYPNSRVVSSSGNSFILNSIDNSDAITAWYEEKIKAEGMSANSFVKGNSNGNVSNKLVGADGAREIRVEITKEAGSSTVSISVELKSSS